MNVIAIYHHPQECGSPYLTFISQESGEVMETVDIPEGYYFSGWKTTEKLTPIRSFTEEYNGNPKPSVNTVRAVANYRFHPNDVKYVVTKVTDIKEDPTFPPTWKATLHVDECKVELSSEYHIEEDTFLNGMTEAGFDMTGWTLPERQKIHMLDFFRKLMEGYKGYHLINVIEIG